MTVAKWTADIILDAACDYVKNNVTEMYVCSGTTSGRKITKNAELAIPVTGSGDATCIVLCSGTVMLSVSTMTLQTLTSGNTVNTPAFRVPEFLDVTP